MRCDARGRRGCSDIEHLRAHQVASDSTLYRTFGWAPGGAVAFGCCGVCARRCVGAPRWLDIDSTWWRCTLRTRRARRRISRRGSGSIRCCAPPRTASRCRSCCGAATPQPTTSRTTSTCSTRCGASPGHCASGGAPAPRQVQLRVDAAGCSVFAQACRQRNIEFFMTARSNDEVTTAIDHNRFDRDTWQPALDGEPSERAQVRELTEFVDLEGWPERTRFIARREPLRRSAPCSTPSCGATAGSTPTPTATPPSSTHASPRTNREHHRRAQRLRPQTHALQRLRRQRRLDATRRAQHGAGEMVPTTAPARPTGSSRPQTPQMATMARTRPARALLKKMDPAPARLVGHSATTGNPGAP